MNKTQFKLVFFLSIMQSQEEMIKLQQEHILLQTQCTEMQKKYIADLQQAAVQQMDAMKRQQAEFDAVVEDGVLSPRFYKRYPLGKAYLKAVVQHVFEIADDLESSIVATKDKYEDTREASDAVNKAFGRYFAHKALNHTFSQSTRLLSDDHTKKRAITLHPERMSANKRKAKEEEEPEKHKRVRKPKQKKDENVSLSGAFDWNNTGQNESSPKRSKSQKSLEESDVHSPKRRKSKKNLEESNVHSPERRKSQKSLEESEVHSPERCKSQKSLEDAVPLSASKEPESNKVSDAEHDEEISDAEGDVLSDCE
jgi:hypothetical protein